MKHGILLNPGHNPLSIGAIGINPEITEQKYTLFLANLIIKEIKRISTIRCETVRQVGRRPSGIGYHAGSFRIFLSLHFNAYAKKEYYSAFLVYPNVNQYTLDFGTTLCERFKKELGYKLYNKNGIMYRDNLAVLIEAAQTDVTIAGLLESQFIDDEIYVDDFEKRLEKESIIIAEKLVEFHGKLGK